MHFEMNMFWAVVFIVVGLTILVKGADWLVDGASSLASRMGVPPFIIGLTVVAMGTSAPEVAASISASLYGAGDIAVGNVYGSNIANLALVGGSAALIRPLEVNLKMLRYEMPVMLVTFLVLLPLFITGNALARPEALLLLVIFAVFLAVTLYRGLRHKAPLLIDLPNETDLPSSVPPVKAPRAYLKSAAMVLAGLAFLTVGADISVRGAVFLGNAIGLSQAVIGLTIIAVGTSLPELMTSLVASYKGEHDISIGNLVGSNIFNTLLVIGVAGTVKPFALSPRLIGADYWICLGISVLFMALCLLRRRLTRLYGGILFGSYIAYLVYLFVFTRNI